ncbi:Alpha/Beta hydrolase protein [Gorgonomyces haynaldii]|nr:Alpha/Beta hydrolase protein [Gorgonomyces haynaldii]
MLSLLLSSVIAIDEASLGTVYGSQIKPFYESGSFGSFTGKDQIPITYRASKNIHSTALIIAPGKGMQKTLYSELVFDLKDQPVTVYLLDHRGQGDSGRLTSDPKVVYVKDFQDYVDDYATFVDQVIKPKHKSVIGFGESMGGLITAAYATQYPQSLSAAVLASPMMGINTSPYPRPIAAGIAGAAVLVGQGEKFAVGQKPYENGTLPAYENANSQARLDMWNTINTEKLATAGGGVAFQWVKTVLSFQDQFFKQSSLMPLPVIMFTAGKDTIVDTAAEKKACDLAVSCKQVSVPNSKHLFTFETDDIRSQYLDNILTFIKPFVL